MSVTHEFDDEALRLLANLEQRYAAWMDAERILSSGRLAWKTVSGADYLYRIVDGRGNGRSLGPRSPETEAQWLSAQTAHQTTASLSMTPSVTPYRPNSPHTSITGAKQLAHAKGDRNKKGATNWMVADRR